MCNGISRPTCAQDIFKGETCVASNMIILAYYYFLGSAPVLTINMEGIYNKG